MPTSFLQIGKLSSQGDRIRKRLLVSGLSEKQSSAGLRREMALSTLSLTLTVLPSSSQLALVVMGDYLDATAVPNGPANQIMELKSQCQIRMLRSYDFLI